MQVVLSVAGVGERVPVSGVTTTGQELGPWGGLWLGLEGSSRVSRTFSAISDHKMTFNHANIVHRINNTSWNMT